MIGNGGGGSQTEDGLEKRVLAYTGAGCAPVCAALRFRMGNDGRNPHQAVPGTTGRGSPARRTAAPVPAQPGLRAGAAGGRHLRVVALPHQSEVDFSAGVVAVVKQGSGFRDQGSEGTAENAHDPLVAILLGP